VSHLKPTWMCAHVAAVEYVDRMGRKFRLTGTRRYCQGVWIGTLFLDAVDVGEVVVVVRRVHLLEVDAVVHVLVAEGHRLVDLDRVGELTV